MEQDNYNNLEGNQVVRDESAFDGPDIAFEPRTVKEGTNPQSNQQLPPYSHYFSKESCLQRIKEFEEQVADGKFTGIDADEFEKQFRSQRGW